MLCYVMICYVMLCECVCMCDRVYALLCVWNARAWASSRVFVHARACVETAHFTLSFLQRKYETS